MNKNYLLRRIEELEEASGFVFPNADTLLMFSESPEGDLLWDGVEVIGSVGTITIGDVAGLQGVLDDKSDVGHTHTVSDVTGLQGDLDGKSDVGHTHGISDVTGLESALAGKASEDELHFHSNKGLLDSLSDDSGSLLYDGSPIGVTSFSELTDAPSVYGTTGQILVVNSTQDGLEYADAPLGGGGGATTFDALTDTPASKTGQGGKFLAVDVTGTNIEYVDAPSGGGGGGGAWTSFTLSVRANRIPPSDINENQGYYRETSDGCIEFFGIFTWNSSASSTAIFIGLPFISDVDFKGLGMLPVNIGGAEVRLPLPKDGGWYGGLRDNGFFEVRNGEAAYPNVDTGAAPRGFTYYAKVPKV